MDETSRIPPERPPADLQAGVWNLKPRPGRPNPFGLEWRVDGKRKKEFFPTEKARDARKSSLLQARSKGAISTKLTRAEIADWQAFQTAIGETPWQDVVAAWRASGKVPCEMTVREAYAPFLAEVNARFARKEFTAGYRRHAEQKVELFVNAFGANRLDAVTSESISEWLDDLPYAANGTFNMYRKMVRWFFEHHRKQLERNPVDDVPARSEIIEKVEILTPDQTQTLFDATLKHHPEAIGRLALEAFAGLRFSSATRLSKSDINFEERGILLPPEKLKTGRRHYIDGLPDNLWLWLARTNAACWALESSQWMHLKSSCFEKAGVAHPRNCLRHSFCTYHVAAYKDPGRTALLLCHRNQQKLWSNYRGIATLSEGLRYFGIQPG